MQRLTIFAFLLLIPSVILNLILYQRVKKQQGEVKVLAVLDGDTVVLENKTRLRLREVDAPEPEYCGGKEAKEYLEKLIDGKKIKVDQMVPDQRGRGMAYVFVGETLVNLEILKSGLARYHHDQTIYSERLKAANGLAKERRLGIYSNKCYQKENLENPKCLIKGNIEHTGQKRKIYYLPNCAQYQFVIVEKDLGEQWFCSEKEAQESGYAKAKTCR